VNKVAVLCSYVQKLYKQDECHFSKNICWLSLFYEAIINLFLVLLTALKTGQEDDETATIQSRPLPRDVFRIRQIQRARGVSNSQTTSAASGGSAFSGDQSVST